MAFEEDGTWMENGLAAGACPELLPDQTGNISYIPLVTPSVEYCPKVSIWTLLTPFIFKVMSGLHIRNNCRNSWLPSCVVGKLT